MSELEKILKACVGAVETVAEKTGEVVDALAEKGAPAYEKAKEAGADLFSRLRDAVNNGAVQQEMEELTDKLAGFSREQLRGLRDLIDRAEAELDKREKQPEAKEEAQAEETAGNEEPGSVEEPEAPEADRDGE